MYFYRCDWSSDVCSSDLDVIGDINSRRGRIEGMEDIGGGKMIRGYVPLSEMFGYATDLRSRTCLLYTYFCFDGEWERYT